MAVLGNSWQQCPCTQRLNNGTQSASTEHLQIRSAAAYRRIGHGCLEEITSMTKKSPHSKNIGINNGEIQKYTRCGFYKDNQMSLPMTTLNMIQLMSTWTHHLETSGMDLWILRRKREFAHLSCLVWQTGYRWCISKACIVPYLDPCIAVAYTGCPGKTCWSWWDRLKQIIY